MKFDFGFIKSAVQSLGGELAKIDKAIAALEAERQYLETSPPAKEDVIELLNVLIDRIASKYPDRVVGRVFNLMRNNPIDKFLALVDGGPGAASLHFFAARPPVLSAREPIPAGIGAPAEVGVRALESNLLFLLRDEIKAGVVRAINESQMFVDSGPPIRVRTPRIEDIVRELAVLQDQRRGLVDEAKAAGLQV